MVARYLFLFLLTCCLFRQNGYAQLESEKDSLESLLPFANDQQRADILNGLANYFRVEDTTRAGNYARQALTLSSKLLYCKGKANATIILGILQKNSGNMDKAREMYLSGLAMALKCKEPYAVSFAYHSLGNLAYIKGDLAKAMRYYIGSVKISEQLKDYPRAARTYNNIGSLYMDLKNPQKAEEYYLRSLDLYKGFHSELIVAEISSNLANIYLDKGFHLKALYYYTEALEVFRQKSSATDISSALNNIGTVYLGKKQAKKAIPYLMESYQIDIRLHEPKGIVLVLDNLGAAYLQLGKLDSAKFFMDKALTYAQKNPNNLDVAEVYQLAANYYLKIGDTSKSDYYRSLKQKIEEKFSKDDTKNQVGLIAAEYETERKKQEIKLLQKENEIKDLKLREQELTIERRNILLIATGVVILFLLLLSALLIFTVNLNKKNKLFEMSNKAKSSMLQQINHEIRTPLNGIVGMSQLAIESKTFSELKDYLTHIKLSSDELMFVLNNLITYLQLDRKEAISVKAPFHLIESLEELFKSYSFQCKQKGLLFNQMVYPGVPEKVVADQQKIMTILQNLLSNAIKHSQKGVVKVEVRQSATRVKDGSKFATLQLVVIDEGPGFSDKEIKNLFKGMPEVSGKGNGFGIGLRNVKQLCDLLKGHMEVISEKGSGSSFIVELEVEILDESVLISNGVKPNSLFNPANFQILIVEDNQLNQRLFIKILEKASYPHAVASNGLEALSLIKEKTFDLILMDIRMPQMDGIETCHHIRNNEEFTMDKNIPIIAVTAHDDGIEKQKCFDVGMNDYLTKPINKEVLLRKIEEQLRKRSI